VIAGIAKFQLVMWAVNWAAGILLLFLLVVRKNYRVYPAFTFYIFLNMLLGTFVYFYFRKWGTESWAAWLFAWGMQALAICARAVAVAEICKHILSGFRGIWALAQRLLVGCVAAVCLYSGLAARHQWESAVPSADRGAELVIAVVIVVLLLFARYYDVHPEPTDRTLAIGFCIFSCFASLNDTVLEHYLYEYAALWSLLGVLAYFASLVLWSTALWEKRTLSVTEKNLFPPLVYESVTPQINLRLRELDEQLSRTFGRGVSQQ